MTAPFANFVPDQPGPMTVIAAAGGLALLLGGMLAMGAGLRRLAGGRARKTLERLGGHPLTGAAVGFIVTAAIHSSGATAMMLVSLVEAGLLTLAAAIPVLLGATVGTTLTAQLLAFRVDWLVPVTLVLGLGLRVGARRDNARAIGEAIYGLGLLFLGLGVLSAALAPLRGTAAVTGAFAALERWPLAGLPIGILVTVLLQSSTASTGVLIGLASQGLVPLPGAIHFILGAHVGTCSTGLLATLGTKTEARRVAVAQLVASTCGALLFVFWVPGFAGIVRTLSSGPAGTVAGATPHEIANAHTLVSVVASLVLLPLARLVERAARALVRDGHGPGRLFYLDPALLSGPVPSPDVALVQVRRAVEVMAAQVADLAGRAIRPGHETGSDVQQDLHRRVAQIRTLRADIAAFLGDIGRSAVRRNEMDRGLELALVATELDAIAQLAHDALALAAEQDEVGPFSAAGQRELEQYRERMLALLRNATAAFLSGDIGAAHAAEQEKERLSRLEESLRRAHLERLRSGVEQSARTDALHLAWLELMRSVNSHAKRVARVVLERVVPPARGRRRARS